MPNRDSKPSWVSSIVGTAISPALQTSTLSPAAGTLKKLLRTFAHGSKTCQIYLKQFDLAGLLDMCESFLRSRNIPRSRIHGTASTGQGFNRIHVNARLHAGDQQDLVGELSCQAFFLNDLESGRARISGALCIQVR